MSSSTSSKRSLVWSDANTDDKARLEKIGASSPHCATSANGQYITKSILKKSSAIVPPTKVVGPRVDIPTAPATPVPEVVLPAAFPPTSMMAGASHVGESSSIPQAPPVGSSRPVQQSVNPQSAAVREAVAAALSKPAVSALGPLSEFKGLGMVVPGGDRAAEAASTSFLWGGVFYNTFWNFFQQDFFMHHTHVYNRMFSPHFFRIFFLSSSPLGARRAETHLVRAKHHWCECPESCCSAPRRLAQQDGCGTGTGSSPATDVG